MCDIGANYIKTIKATTLFVVFLFVHSWEQRKLGDLFNYYRPDNYIVKSDKYVENAPTPVLTANKGFILGYTNENRSFSQPCIIFDDFTLDSKFVDFPFMVKSSAMKILVLKDEKIDDLIFCYELLNSTKIEVLGHARHYISVVQPTAINIPRYEEQRRISELFQQISNLITLHQRKDFSRFSQILRRKKHSFLPISWEQRKLWQLTIWDKKFNGVESYKQVKVIKYPYVLADVFSQIEDTSGTVRLLSTGSYIGYTTKEKAGNNLCYGEIVAIPWGGVANIKYYNGFFVTADNRIATSSNTQVLSNRYLHWWMESNITQIQSTYRGASIQHPSMNDILSLSIYLPSIEEQEKISNKLDTLDNLITLHQRECFYIYKKYLLFLEMQNSHKRNYSWEQRKLGDLVKEVTRRDPNSNAPIMMITANNGFIEQSERYAFNNAGESLKKYILLQKGELAYNHGASKLRPYGSCFALTTAENARIPFVYHCFSAERMNHEFLSIELNGNGIESQLRSIVSSGARMDGLLNISFGEYTSVSILFPKKNEQDKIADFFRQLDNLITLHQCESCKKVAAVQSAFARRNLSKWADSWEQRKLGDLVKEVTRRDPNSNAPIMMITANNGFIEQSERYAFNNAGESLKKYILLQKGELAYNHGASKLRPYGSCFALTTAENARIPFVYHCFSAERMNHEFLSIELNGNGIESQLRSIVSSGARMDGLLNISFGEYTSVSILFPKKNEQDKIADFFRQLDNLITLHQCKVFYKNIIFNNIKFGGLETENNTSWEQRKFNELYEKVSEKNDLTYGTDEIISVANMYFKSDSFITDKEYLRTYNVFHLGDIAFEGNKSKNFAHGRFVENTIGDGIVSHVFDVFRPKIKYDLLFWKYAINNERLMGGILVRSTKASTMMTNLVANDFLRETILVPSLEEQKKIGSILENVDNLITLHQRIKIFFTGDYHDKKNK